MIHLSRKSFAPSSHRRRQSHNYTVSTLPQHHHWHASSLLLAKYHIFQVNDMQLLIQIACQLGKTFWIYSTSITTWADQHSIHQCLLNARIAFFQIFAIWRWQHQNSSNNIHYLPPIYLIVNLFQMEKLTRTRCTLHQPWVSVRRTQDNHYIIIT